MCVSCAVGVDRAATLLHQIAGAASFPPRSTCHPAEVETQLPEFSGSSIPVGSRRARCYRTRTRVDRTDQRSRSDVNTVNSLLSAVPMPSPLVAIVAARATSRPCDQSTAFCVQSSALCVTSTALCSPTSSPCARTDPLTGPTDDLRVPTKTSIPLGTIISPFGEVVSPSSTIVYLLGPISGSIRERSPHQSDQ